MAPIMFTLDLNVTYFVPLFSYYYLNNMEYELKHPTLETIHQLYVAVSLLSYMCELSTTIHITLTLPQDLPF